MKYLSFSVISPSRAIISWDNKTVLKKLYLLCNPPVIFALCVIHLKHNGLILLLFKKESYLTKDVILETSEKMKRIKGIFKRKSKDGYDLDSSMRGKLNLWLNLVRSEYFYFLEKF